MSKSKIEWTDWTDNPIGVIDSMSNYCVKVSPACKNCYAESMSRRLAAMSGVPFHPYQVSNNRPGMELREKVLERWPRMKKSRKIFVGSMTDLFGGWVSPNWIFRIFDAMMESPRQTFQLLTKRPENMRSLVNAYCKDRGMREIPNHIWLGITAESQEWYDKRMIHLLETKAHTRWVSIEPMLGPIDLRLSYNFDIAWVVVGGEQAPAEKCRPMHPDWVRSIHDQCALADVAFFFKQWGNWQPTDKPKTTTGPYRYCWFDRTQMGGDMPKLFRPESHDVVKLSLDLVLRSNHQWFKWGKKENALLDGNEYREFPRWLTSINCERTFTLLGLGREEQIYK